MVRQMHSIEFRILTLRPISLLHVTALNVSVASLSLTLKITHAGDLATIFTKIIWQNTVWTAVIILYSR